MTWYAVHSTPNSFGSLPPKKRYHLRVHYIMCSGLVFRVFKNTRNTKPEPARLPDFFSLPDSLLKTQPADICLLLLCYLLVLVTFAFIMELQTLHSCGCVIKVANRIILSRSDGQQDIE